LNTCCSFPSSPSSHKICSPEEPGRFISTIGRLSPLLGNLHAGSGYFSSSLRTRLSESMMGIC
jgi:hypothetical protein